MTLFRQVGALSLVSGHIASKQCGWGRNPVFLTLKPVLLDRGISNFSVASNGLESCCSVDPGVE